MTEYRIKKETTSYGSFSYDKYFPQQKIIAPSWWRNVFGFDHPGFDTLEQAREALCYYMRGPVVEYIDFDCERDCK